MSAYPGGIVAAQHQTAGSRVLLHGAPQAMLCLFAHPVDFGEHQHLKASLAFGVNRSTSCNLLFIGGSHGSVARLKKTHDHDVIEN